MTEDAQNACKELDLLSVTTNVLVLQEFDDGLCSRHSYCCHRFLLTEKDKCFLGLYRFNILYIRVGEHKVTYLSHQIMCGRDEATQRAYRRAIIVELIHGHAIFVIGAAEIRDILIH